MKKFLISLFLLATPVFGQVGETANFQLNKNLSSTIITSGKVNIAVTSYDQEKKTYEVQAECAFKVRLVGNLGGKEKLNLTENLFNGSLLATLREQRVIRTDDFVATYKDYEDIKTQNGVGYHAERITISEIKTGDEESNCLKKTLQAIANAVAKDQKVKPSSVENLIIDAWLSNVTPVAGLVRVAVSGKTSGFSFKATLDYE